MMDKAKGLHTHKPYYYNRELSWLKFNERVLDEAIDKEVPLCERLSFVSIFQSNLDEFFMVRVGTLTDQMIFSADARDNKTQMTAKEQLSEIFTSVGELLRKKDRAYLNLMSEIGEYGIELISFNDIEFADAVYLENYFKHSIMPLLSPQIVGKKQPFPFLRNKEIYAVALLKSKNNEKLGIVPCSSEVFKRLIPIPSDKNKYMLVEELILHFMPQIFSKYTIKSKSLIRIIRNADIDVDDAFYDEDLDYRNTMEKMIRERRKLCPVKMEYSRLLSGNRSYREKLVGYYAKFNINLTADDIIITSGGSEAVLFSFLSCLNPGDEIIVPEPAYANYMAFAISAGAKIRTIATTIEEGFSLPKVEKFEELINERTKAILICNPNNPTGYLYTRREMNQIRDLVKKYDLFLFSDEVYREFIYTGSPYISACHLEGIENNVVLIDSVSKRYSECGIRIGALITKNKEIRDAVMKFCQARLSPPLIGQIAAEASLDAPEEYSRETYDEYVERRKCLIDGLNRIPGVYSPIPMGAFYTVAKLPVDDSDKFCAWCLSDFEYEGQTVFMAPASGFYTTPGSGINEVRIAYVLKKEDLTRALFILQKALEAYPGRTE